MALEGDVNVLGMHISKKAAAAGGVGLGAIAIIFYLRYRKNAAASAAQNASSANTASTGGGQVTDPAGNVCASLDPSTGYCPGTPEDQAMQEQLASSGSDDAALGEDLGYGADGGYNTGTYVTDPAGNICAAIDPATGYCPGFSASGSNGASGTSGTITTNAEWAQEVIEAQPSWQTAVASVLGGVPVSSQQKTLFLEATGIYGTPPQAYPPIQVTSTGDGSGASQVTVPKVTGERVMTANAVLAAKGLKSHLSGNRKAGVSYYVNSQTPAAGAKVSRGATIDLGISTKA
jgi:hypothetical protein